jgi:Dolichyl-phosphate-mannose-protein mannosyltransferase
VTARMRAPVSSATIRLGEDRSAGEGRRTKPWLDIAVLLGLLAIAAVLRLPDLATRGPWDTDQGEQMLAIRAIVNGQLTLLGAQTSTGGIHHGSVFYYVGALFALPTGGDDPTWVTFGIALGGIATVGFVWWLARAAGAGIVGAAVAGLLTAVSAQMIDASVRLWNPAFVAPAAAFALAAAFEGRRRSDPRWWILVGIGLVLAGQSHVLAWVLVAPLAVLAVDELRRTGRRALPWLAAAAAIVALSFVPLLINELTTGFSELQALVRVRAGIGDEVPPLWLRAAFVPLRVLAIPLVGDIGRSLVLVPVAFAVVVGAGMLAMRSWKPAAARSTGLLAAGLILGCAGLVVGAPWLAQVTPLYVDHYHLALDPIVFALMGLGAATLWRHDAGRVVVGAVVGAVAAWNLLVVPLPPVNADGGWPAGRAAGQRVVDELDGLPALIIGSPEFKKTTAVDYPMTVLGNPPVAPSNATGTTRVVVLCDELFEEIVGAACQGPAEEARLAEVGIVVGPLLDRFEAAPGRWISVYEIAGR